MKKLYVSPDAEYLKIDFIENVLGESIQSSTLDSIDKGEVDLDAYDEDNSVSNVFGP